MLDPLHNRKWDLPFLRFSEAMCGAQTSISNPLSPFVPTR